MTETKAPPMATPMLNGKAVEPIHTALAEACAAVAKAYALAKATQTAGRLHDDLVLKRLEFAYDSLGSIDRDWEEACSPRPPLEPAADDLAWALDHYVELRPTHMNRHVAIVDRQVLGSGPDPIALRADVAKEHGLDPERVVVIWID